MPSKSTPLAKRVQALERQLSNANDALEAALAVSPERDNTFFTGGLSGMYEGRTSWERKKIFAESLRAWRVNPIARRIVKLITSFVIGKGITIKSDDPATQKFLSEWWKHPLNNLNRAAKRWKDEDTRTGNLFILFNVLNDGNTILRAVPAEKIEEIQSDESDIEQEVTFTLDPAEDKSYPAYDRNAEQNKFMIHFASNQPVGSTWGEADLSPLLVWIGRYSSWLEDRVRLNRFRTAFMYVITGKYKNEAERSAREKQINANPPKPGSVLVANEEAGEVWDTLSAKLDSSDANTDGLAIKKNIASGIGFPLHYLAEPESATRTTAEAAGTPTFRTLEEAQNDFFNVLIDCARVACEIKNKVDQSINPEAEIWIEGPDITERDNATLALALGRAYPNLIDIYDREGIEPEELMRLLYKMLAEVRDEKKVPQIKRKPIVQPTAQPQDGSPRTPFDDKTDPDDPANDSELMEKIDELLSGIKVEPPNVTIHVPEQPAPVVNINQPAPVVKLTAPALEQPPVIVNVKPPNVQVKNEIKIPKHKETMVVKRNAEGQAEQIEKTFDSE